MYDDDVEIRKAHHAMLIIQALDSTAHLAFSGATNIWWVVAKLGIGSEDEGLTAGALFSHEDPNQAVIGYLLKLQTVKTPKYVTITGHSNLKRNQFRWNGAAFARVGVEDA